MADRTRNGGDSEKVTVRKQPGSDNSPARGGYSHADTRMGHTHSEALADPEHAVTGSIPPRREDEGSGSDADAMSRGGKENEGIAPSGALNAEGSTPALSRSHGVRKSDKG